MQLLCSPVRQTILIVRLNCALLPSILLSENEMKLMVDFSTFSLKKILDAPPWYGNNLLMFVKREELQFLSFGLNFVSFLSKSTRLKASLKVAFSFSEVRGPLKFTAEYWQA